MIRYTYSPARNLCHAQTDKISKLTQIMIFIVADEHLNEDAG